MRALADRIAVVTGAAGGIGGAIAKRLASEGCRIVLLDRTLESLSAVALEIGPRAVGVHAFDVSERAAWEGLAAELAREHGGIDVLVNNAGVTVHGAFAEQSMDDIERVVRVNLLGVLYGSRALLPLLAVRARDGRGEAHIVNVSSLGGTVAFPFQSTYCATKFGVRGFGHALRLELADRGIGVTTVLPGTIATRLLETAASYDASTSKRLAALMLAYGTPPARVAERIVRAILANEAEITIGWDAHLTRFARRVAPALVTRAFAAGVRWHRP